MSRSLKQIGAVFAVLLMTVSAVGVWYTGTAAADHQTYCVMQGSDVVAQGVTPMQGSTDVASFYDYRTGENPEYPNGSYSSYMAASGPGTAGYNIPKDQAARMFLYEAPDETVSLVMIMNRREGVPTDSDHQSAVTYELSGADGLTFAVEDDDYDGQDDRFSTSQIDLLGSEGRTDGAALSGFDSGSVTIDGRFNDDAAFASQRFQEYSINSWEFLTETDPAASSPSFESLDMSQPLTISAGTCDGSAPDAAISGPGETTTGTEVTFDASASQDTNDDGSIASYHWDFGDGTKVTTDGPTVTHTYSGIGTRTVKVTVTDDSGNEATATTSITVREGDGSSGGDGGDGSDGSDGGEEPKDEPPVTGEGPEITGVKAPNVAESGSTFTVRAEFANPENVTSVEWYAGGKQIGSGNPAQVSVEAGGFQNVKVVASDGNGTSKAAARVYIKGAVGGDGGSSGGGGGGDSGGNNNAGSGGGDGGGASETDYTVDPEEKKSQKTEVSVDQRGDGTATVDVENAKKNEPVVASVGGEVGDAKVGFGEVSVTLSKAVSFTMNVQVTEQAPKSVSAPEQGFEPASYINISHPNLGNDAIANASFTYTMKGSTLESMNTKPGDVVTYVHHDGEWQELDTKWKEVDGGYKFKVNTEGFSVFAVGTHAASTQVTNVALSNQEVTAGSSVDVTATVQNTGKADGMQTVTLTMDGEEVATKNVTVAAGQTKEVAFTLDVEKPGTHTVSVGEMKAQLNAMQENTTTTTTTTSTDETTTTSTGNQSNDDDSTTSDGQPGFGLALALVAILGAALLALRRE